MVLSSHGELIAFSIPISRANELFDANYTSYTHVLSGEQFVRTMSFSIPSELAAHVTTIHPSTSFPEPEMSPQDSKLQGPPALGHPQLPKRDQPTLNASCSTMINPECLEALYGIPITPAKNKKNKLFVTGYGGRFSNMADLQVKTCKQTSLVC
jgi:tripeptidyl-peptidase I